MISFETWLFFCLEQRHYNSYFIVKPNHKPFPLLHFVCIWLYNVKQTLPRNNVQTFSNGYEVKNELILKFQISQLTHFHVVNKSFLSLHFKIAKYIYTKYMKSGLPAIKERRKEFGGKSFYDLMKCEIFLISHSRHIQYYEIEHR